MFRLPRFTWSRTPALWLRLIAKADGHRGNRASLPEDPETPTHIGLKKIKHIKKVQAIDALTEEPIPFLEIRIDNRMDDGIVTATDEKGFFFVPMDHHESFLEAPGYEDVRFRHPDREAPSWVVPFRPFVKSVVRVHVLDEWERPLNGARVELSSERELVKDGQRIEGFVINQNSRTDQAGLAEIKPITAAGSEAHLNVTHAGYEPYRSETIILSDDRDHEETVILKRGTLFQRIHLEDEQGAPLREETLIAELTLPGGHRMQMHARSDRKGRCSMAFPRFEEAALYIQGRPDTRVPLDFDSILKQEEIKVVLFEEVAPDFAIQGTIRNARGMPLEGIRVKLVQQRFAGKPIPDWAFKSRKTDEQGAFRILAGQDSTYVLEITNPSADGFKYHSVTFDNLERGDYRDIILEVITGIVEADLDWIKGQFGFLPSSQDLWLEDETGGRLTFNQGISPDGKLQLFYHRSPGTYCLAGKSKDGEIKKTSFFEVRAGERTRIP
jgi:hypothetical protein